MRSFIQYLILMLIKKNVLPFAEKKQYENENALRSKKRGKPSRCFIGYCIFCIILFLCLFPSLDNELYSTYETKKPNVNKKHTIIT